MSKTVVLAVLLFSFGICGCTEKKLLTSEQYKGDGEITFIDQDWPYADGWLITFNEFPLAQEYSYKYRFSGLPRTEVLSRYDPYFHIPPSLNRSDLDSAFLRLTLYGDGEQISTLKSSLKEWSMSTFHGRGPVSKEEDELTQTFSCRMVIPADSNIQYELEVHYSPPDSIKVEGSGRFYLKLGGEK